MDTLPPKQSCFFKFLGHVLLYISCILQHVDIMKFLVQKGIDVNTTLSTKTFYTSLERPLSVVCQNKNYEMAQFLIENKAEITKSVANQHPEMIGNLLKRYIYRICFGPYLYFTEKMTEEQIKNHIECIGCT